MLQLIRTGSAGMSELFLLDRLRKLPTRGCPKQCEHEGNRLSFGPGLDLFSFMVSGRAAKVEGPRTHPGPGQMRIEIEYGD